MKLKDVPQDNDLSYEGAKKLTYAQDESGKFVATTSNGWHVEETVKSLAWKVIEADLEETRKLLIQNKTSALEYFMKLRQMDPLLLSQNMDISLLRVKWHLRPGVFKRLNPSWIQKYADCLEISVETLRSYNGQNGKPSV